MANLIEAQLTEQDVSKILTAFKTNDLKRPFEGQGNTSETENEL